MSILQRFKKTPEQQKHRLPKVLHAMEMLLVEHRSVDKDRDRDLDWEYEHMNESVRYARMLAGHRKLGPDLAACAAAIQNIGSITEGRTQGHAEAGYEPANRLLTALGCFSASEVHQLATTVKNHSRKDKVDAPMDELAKDVDVYVRYVQGYEVNSADELRRLSKIKLEIQTKVK